MVACALAATADPTPGTWVAVAGTAVAIVVTATVAAPLHGRLDTRDPALLAPAPRRRPRPLCVRLRGPRWCPRRHAGLADPHDSTYLADKVPDNGSGPLPDCGQGVGREQHQADTGRTQPTPHRVVSEIRKRYAAAGGANTVRPSALLDGPARRWSVRANPAPPPPRGKRSARPVHPGEIPSFPGRNPLSSPALTSPGKATGR